jgi:hypothetical protein
MSLIDSAITPRRAAHAGALIAWARDYLSVPYPGPGFSRTGAICPYTRKMVEDDKLLILLADGIDGTEYEKVLQASLSLVTHTLATVGRDDTGTAVILGFPDMTSERGFEHLDTVVSSLVTALLSVGITLVAVYEIPGSSPLDAWPLGARVPMPSLVLRRLGPWDAALSKTEESSTAHHRLYLDWYLAGRMTPHDALAFEAMCAKYALPLTPERPAQPTTR